MSKNVNRSCYHEAVAYVWILTLLPVAANTVTATATVGE